jgi:hypothetical protein
VQFLVGAVFRKARLNRLKIIVLAGLAALDVFAAAFLWRGFAGEGDNGGLVARPVLANVRMNPLEYVTPPRGDDTETLARPLFSKSRRPSPPPEAPAKGEIHTPPPAGIKLNAVILFGRSARAFITSNALIAGKWLAVGETFENWTADSIETHEVALHQGARLIRVGVAYNGVTSPISSNSEPPSSAKAELTNWPLPPRITKPPSLDEVKSWIRQRH